ncbi:hypothetical protein BN12_4030008 [Nostocoides japonicum T1-X7]|uniref:H repeat-associated protein N-terminal domain-containing protein n=1 Tax=Nostocoides japonicum T1-X7 TaxID=1194083 RepID=A0A077LYZ5_9MICO|nr:hypothetical protein BN12_4030008 [Tetrasphaera japonica T1-X7]
MPGPWPVGSRNPLTLAVGQLLPASNPSDDAHPQAASRASAKSVHGAVTWEDVAWDRHVADGGRGACGDHGVSTRRPVSRKPHAAMSSCPTSPFARIPLTEVFAQVPDPRDPRGVRHPLAGLLSIASAAVSAGARSLVAIGEWVTDAAQEALQRLGIGSDRAMPSESTIRRTLAVVDADDLDQRVGRGPGRSGRRAAGHRRRRQVHARRRGRRPPPAPAVGADPRRPRRRWAAGGAGQGQ